VAVPAYSQVLWTLVPGYSLVPPQLSPPVPAGFVWVVREISACLASTTNFGKGTPQLRLNVGQVPLWSTPFNRTVHGVIYESRDSRFVLAAGGQLAVNLVIDGWYLRVSGYQLTA
jgi:hypothetical protein